MMHFLSQHLAPQHLLTRFAGWVADCKCSFIKNWIIRRFIKKYKVDMSEARIENIEDYPTFNSFFTRQLKPELRPIVQGHDEIACPVDGCVSQLGDIQSHSLLQAKGFRFDLNALLGNSTLANSFQDGVFATLYLSPKDYHRVHMPYAGKLRETIYIPGKLFSVSQRTAQSIPNLFARNERLVCIFDTAIGPMAVILVGAMIVGSINTIWDMDVLKPELNRHAYPDGIELPKGAELGHFKLGSTVILLFGKNKVKWVRDLSENSSVRMGQLLGTNSLG